MTQNNNTEVEAQTAIIQAGSAALQQFDITADAVVDMFLQQHDVKESSTLLYKRALRQFFAWVARTGRTTYTLTRADVIAYKKGLLDGEATEDGKKRSPLTVASYLTAVKLFYTWLHNENGTITNIAAGVTLPNHVNMFERKPLKANKVEELLQEVSTTATARDNAIINLLLTTGMRTIEVVRADIKDMQSIGGDPVLYVQGKGQLDKQKYVPLMPDTYTAIVEYLKTRPTAAPEAPLFTCAGNRNKNGRLTTRTISAIARRHLDAIGLTHNIGERNSSYTAHSFRHTYACTMLEDTGNVHDVQLMLRHASANTTQKYIYHLDDMRKLEIAKKHNIEKLYKTAR